MKITKSPTTYFSSTLCAALVVASVFVSEAWAQQQSRKVPGLSQSIMTDLEKAAVLASPPEEPGKPVKEPDFQGAMAALQRLEKNCIDKCNKYELASIYRYMGWVAYQLENVEGSVNYYKLVVAQSPEIPLGIELEALLYLSKLLFGMERLDESLSYLEKWIAQSTEVTADIYQMKASICYAKEDTNCAIQNIDIAVKMVEESGRVPQDTWYSLQRALYYQKEDFPTVLTILIKQLRHYPKQSYWTALGAVYGILGRENDQLYAYDTTYLMEGLDKEQQLLNLAYLFIGAEVPYRAAEILEKGMKDKTIEKTEKNLELLSRAFYAAQEVEKAIPVMEEAAKKSGDGDLYSQLAGMYIQLDDNKNAITAGGNALKKGSLKRAGEVHYNIGRAYFELKNYDDAIEAFAKSAKYKETEKLALSWKTHAEREKSRVEQLAADAERVEAGGVIR